MVSTYHGVETGRRAIEYFRKGMEISGVNTSNAVKAGYSRQVVNASATPALSTATNMSQLGTGVQIESIERMRDLFLDAQLRRTNIDQAYWGTMVDGTTRVETFIVDSKTKQLNDALDSFWTSLQTVHVSPSDEAVRGTLLPESESLTTFVSALHKSYTSYRDELNDDIRAMTEEANALIDRIALLSTGIHKVTLAGAEPNELLDQRDLLADELCRLTGATVGTKQDELEGDYKITIGGKLVVQGTNVRHLMLVENPANSNYLEVQIEYNQYDITSDPDVAQVIVERRADDLRALQNSCTMDGTHELEVLRTADELYWTVGYGEGQLTGGSRLDQVKDRAQALSINGSFALQVGSTGVRAVSHAFEKTPPGEGIILGEPGIGEATEYSFRIASGDFESTITVKWDATTDPGNPAWKVSDSLTPSQVQNVGPAFSGQELSDFIGANYGAHNITASFSAEDLTLTVETTDRQLLSITDMHGALMQSSGLANGNPVVLIEVAEDDSLQTIANKINNAYRFDRTDAGTLSYTTIPPNTAPDEPNEWMHASVETDAGGNCYLCLTSNVAGEAARINVMPGTVCEGTVSEMYVAELLGLVENEQVPGDGGMAGLTSYIQFDREDASIVTRYTPEGDVFVDDAYVRYDGREYISASNDFKDARKVAVVGNAPVETMEEFSPGIRVFLKGAGDTTITVRHPLTQGEIFANIKLRDDVLLAQMDTFDDIMYELATQFNALHYAGYGINDYAETTGMGFFKQIANRYGAFDDLALEDELAAGDQSRIACATGNGEGKSLGCHDGMNALSMAQLKQEKLFLSGTSDFNGLYGNFVAELGSFGAHAKTVLDNDNHVAEQIEKQRKSIMGVNGDEELLNLVELNKSFTAASQYVSTLMQVLDQIISSVGRVGL